MPRFKNGDVVRRISIPDTAYGKKNIPQVGSVGVVVKEDSWAGDVEVRFFNGQIWGCNENTLEKVEQNETVQQSDS